MRRIPIPRAAAAAVAGVASSRSAVAAASTTLARARSFGSAVAPLPLSALTAITGVDGRYGDAVASLRPYFSEFALIRARVEVEVEWLRALSTTPEVAEVPPLSAQAQVVLNRIVAEFGPAQAERVKALERTTNHDVKAVEYYLKECFASSTELSRVAEFLHFGCTSEDISNLAYGITFKRARAHVLLPAMKQLVDEVASKAKGLASTPMLCRTHGQPATPSTMGKELANFAYRLARQEQQVAAVEVLGKFGGAVGCYNALRIAYADRSGLDWESVGRRFVEGQLGLHYNPYCTQIEPHDWIAEMFHAISRFNTVLISLDRDMWGYISLGYFKQRVVAGEVGSSTMPHKVNPIDFENSEGNLGVANALGAHFAEKLPISRFQRDLSDSTVLRNMGTATALSLIAWKSTMRGLGKVHADAEVMKRDVDAHAEVLGEAIQTAMRRHGASQPYEKLKEFTRGKGALTLEALRQFTSEQEAAKELPPHAADRLRKLLPSEYIGLSENLASTIDVHIARMRGEGKR